MKISIFIIICFLNFEVFSQNSTDLFTKLKQDYDEQTFYKNIFQNPSLMRYFGKYSFSKVAAVYQNRRDQIYQIQKSNNSDFIQFLATSFLPLNKTTTLWGNASYTNQRRRNIRWNESIDYQIISPYITADSIGGKMKTEIYSFLGGYAKQYKKFDIGAELSYKANLSSRNIDPRPKNISSNLNIKVGVNFKPLPLDIGIYANGQKYTQLNELTFYSEISTPAIYHLNGLGYFNQVLKGTKNNATYKGIGFSIGSEIISKKKDFILSFRYRNLSIDKLIQNISSNITVAQLRHNYLNLDITKLFHSKKYTYGIKTSYENHSKKGIEPILSSRNGTNIEILKQNENYSFKKQTYSINGLFLKEHTRYLFNISPYILYQQYKENYFLVTSYQNFDYLKGGLKFEYLQKVNTKHIYSFTSNLNYRKTLKKTTLLRNDSETSISNMLKHNAHFLSENIIQSDIKLGYNYALNQTLNISFKIGSTTYFFKDKINYTYFIYTGISF